MSDINKLKEEFPSKCWDCEFARRTWAESLEDKGYVGCSYILNKNISTGKHFRDEERKLEDLFDYTDADQINEGWITQRRPLDRSENGGRSAFNLQPIMHSINKCMLYEQRNR